MRTEFVRIYKAVHTWTGIIAGMALFIAFYAGALTVFKEPLARWAAPPAAMPAVALEDTPQLIARVLAADPMAARDFTIHLTDTEQVPGRMGWQVRDPDADEHDETSVRHYAATLDADGQARIESVHPSQLASFIDVLHRVVGLPVDSDPNRWVMGIIAVLYALALVSGVVVLLPSLVKDFFALRVGRNLKRMWLDAHNVVGIVSLPFHLVMALTAVVFAYHDGIYVVQDSVIHDGKWGTAFQRPPPSTAAPTRDPAAMLPPLELVARAKAFAPGFEPTLLQYQQVTGPRAVVRVWGKDAAAVSPRARGGFAALDPYSGKVIGNDFLPGRQSTPNLFISSFFALHMAAFGGTPVQWMYFVLGLAGAWLFYSGNLLWVESRRRKQPRSGGGVPAQRRDVRLLAAATVGVCLGCVCGISVSIVGSKWAYGLVGDADAWLRPLYYSCFFGCIAWAFMRGAARAGVSLLWLAAASTLAIPLTSCVAVLMPGLNMWAHTSPSSLGVDMTACVGALAFGWMAKAAARRARHGAPDSVWSGKQEGGLGEGAPGAGVQAK
ncbi:PepSY domain-containing protein [Zoogloea sp.]|uniref:PepSY-associated TM helix domain-containing protein n=1 Tax=Zoogloea sp. TaxID=49181 RepID=UPI0025FAAD26|nr:PepSY-associated TM helix domain-containing protein [Zoogloea sp.]MCK6395146.1 PepSY domain-containing protein [Zoogloea sp.]